MDCRVPRRSGLQDITYQVTLDFTASQRHMRLKASKPIIDARVGLMLPSLIYPRGSVIYIYIWTSDIYS